MSEETETTLHDDLSAAYDEVTAAEPTPAESSPTPPPESTPVDSAPEKETPPASARARDERGKFTTKPKAGPAQPNGAAKPVSANGEGAAASEVSQSPKEAAAPAPEPTQPALKAPQSWKPAAREKWAALPPEVQHEAIRREREAESALRESTEARRVHSQFREITDPYRALIEAEGSEPMTAVKALLQGSALLRIGNQEQKAQYVAGLIRKFGVDVGVLGSTLAGQPVPQSAPNGQQFRDPRVDEMIARAKQEQGARDQRLVREATTNVEKFAAEHEFFSDVLPDFELVYEAMSKRNPDVEPDFETVYDRAVAMNPEIAAIIAQRKAAESAATSQGATQRARQAASSVRSRPTVPVSNGDTRHRDLRGDIEAAMEEVAAR